MKQKSRANKQQKRQQLHTHTHNKTALNLCECIFSVIFLIAAVLNLCAVSYDRLKAIVMPLEGRITTRGAKRLTLLTWLASLAIASPFAIYRYYKVATLLCLCVLTVSLFSCTVLVRFFFFLQFVVVVACWYIYTWHYYTYCAPHVAIEIP